MDNISSTASTAMHEECMGCLSLTAREPSLDVLRQILTSKDDPCTEKIKKNHNGHRPIT